MLFIATARELRKIPLSAQKPDLLVEKISGEYLPVKAAFTNQNIYFVGTSQGCSCDFGIHSNQLSKESFEKISPVQGLLNKCKKVRGTFEEWEKSQKEKVDNRITEQASYLKQTQKLIDIILSETKNNRAVELFCVWAGNYSDDPESIRIVDTKKIDLKENFEIKETELKIFL